jgi:hypothetical protein
VNRVRGLPWLGGVVLIVATLANFVSAPRYEVLLTIVIVGSAVGGVLEILALRHSTGLAAVVVWCLVLLAAYLFVDGIARSCCGVRVLDSITKRG